jgi:hypothetical protein
MSALAASTSNLMGILPKRWAGQIGCAVDPVEPLLVRIDSFQKGLSAQIARLGRQYKPVTSSGFFGGGVGWTADAALGAPVTPFWKTLL